MFLFYACISYVYYSNFEQLNQLNLNFSPTTSNFSEILKLSKPMNLSVNYIEKAIGILWFLVESFKNLGNNQIVLQFTLRIITIIIIVDIHRNFSFFLSLWIPGMVGKVYSCPFLKFFSTNVMKGTAEKSPVRAEGTVIVYHLPFRRKYWNARCCAAWFSVKSLTAHWDEETCWRVAFPEYNFLRELLPHSPLFGHHGSDIV